LIQQRKRWRRIDADGIDVPALHQRKVAGDAVDCWKLNAGTVRRKRAVTYSSYEKALAINAQELSVDQRPATAARCIVTWHNGPPVKQNDRNENLRDRNFGGTTRSITVETHILGRQQMNASEISRTSVQLVDDLNSSAKRLLPTFLTADCIDMIQAHVECA
jgi:hypothetical protein